MTEPETEPEAAPGSKPEPAPESEPKPETEPAKLGAGSASIAKKAVSGAFWSVATGVGSRVISLASTLIVTRYVDPKAYGEVSVAYVVTQLASLAASLGVGQYVSTKPNASRKELFHAAAVFHVAGIAALALVYLFRTPLGPIFGADHIERYIAGYLIATFFERLALIPESMLIRDMRFRAGGLIGTVAELVYSVLVLYLAVRGYGGMAIVYGGVARCFLRAALGLWVTDRREWSTFHKLDREIVRGVLRFGLPITGARLSSIIARRGDNLAFSTLFGPARMGAYNLAYNLADVPATTVGERLGDVLVPSFAKLPENERPGALLRSLPLVGFAVFPLAALLGGISRPLTLLLNDTWQALDVRWMLLVLATLSISRPIEWALRVYLQVAAKTRTIMLIEWAKAGAIMAAIFSVGRLGPVAACAAVAGTFMASVLVYMAVIARIARVSFASFVRALAKPFVCATAMLGGLFLIDRIALSPMALATHPSDTGVGFLDRYVLTHWGAATGITLGLLVGVALYVVITYLVARDELRRMVQILRRSRSKKPS
ncbi:MAG: oligosaccharide flippase family protein [Polyangiaceae bacterium]